MKKIFLIIILVFAGWIGVQAQFAFKGGINMGLPVGYASDISSFTLGVEIQEEYTFDEKTSAIISTGYTHFIAKDLGVAGKINYGVVPILAGARGYGYPFKKFFIGGQIGYGFFTGELASGGFAFKPQVGCNVGSAQLALSYTGIANHGTIGWVALSALFKFNTSK
jgi:hypothetical protein